MPLGRSKHNYCNDFQRCRLCRSDLCNTRDNYTSLFCYHTPPGDYHSMHIRKDQLDFMDMCEGKHKYCITIIDEAKKTVMRGCGDGTEKGALRCQGHLCNNQSMLTYCFTCNLGDPNCVFSQGKDSHWSECEFSNVGCFTRIYGDGSVERGCTKNKTDTVLDTTYWYCDNKILCNGLSTKRHSCNMFNGGLYDKPQTPDFLKDPWATRNGFFFASCPDNLNLPACYTRTYMEVVNKNVSKYRLQSGCTKDITELQFLEYDRSTTRSMLEFGTTLCDGHYCNKLPLHGPMWIPLDDDESDSQD